jgi:mannitol-1-/sugar-/sorbitol-6-phosphatase
LIEQVCITTKGILFDMDGVLVSSIGSVIRSWRRWAEMYEVPNAEIFEVPHGMRAIEIVQSLRPDIDPHEGLRVIEDIEIEDTADLTVLPGAKELLAGLPLERWSIVTSATRRLVLTRLAAAELPVPDRLITADMVERGKPDPEPYIRGAQVLGFRPEDCIVIEDAPSGVGAGVAAGSRVLGVLGTHTANDLHAASWLVSSLEDLHVMVKPDSLELRFTPVR